MGFYSQEMQAEQIANMEAAINAALEGKQRLFDEKLGTIVRELDRLKVKTSKIETFKEIIVTQGVDCNEPLDIIKSVPKFDGKQETHISWRHAAIAAYKVFEPFNGSSRHYQAVAILKNKLEVRQQPY